MKRNSKYINGSDMMMREPGFDWTCGVHRLVTRNNFESFKLLLTRIGAESIIVDTDPCSRIESNWTDKKGNRVDDLDTVWETSEIRIRIRISNMASTPVAAYMEIEKRNTGVRRSYQCTSSELIISICSCYNDKRDALNRERLIKELWGKLTLAELQAKDAKAEAEEAKAIARNAESIAMGILRNERMAKIG